MAKLTKEEMSPLHNLDDWDEDVLKRYPEAGKPAKEKDGFRNYDSPEIDGVREF